jgi:hypothetical protein
MRAPASQQDVDLCELPQRAPLEQLSTFLRNLREHAAHEERDGMASPQVGEWFSSSPSEAKLLPDES